MLNLVTGTPGAKKTVFVVSKLDKIERDNKVNLVKNKDYYISNKSFIDAWRSDFSYIETESGSGHRLTNSLDVLPDDYFDIFLEDFDDLRPDDYYLRVTRFNQICDRISEREGVTSFKFLLPVRTIYTNINALKIDFVRDIEHDWRTCPDGSIIVIDEVQLISPFDEIKNKNEPIIQQLTVHRHRGFDFYFITQYPSLLHPTVKDLIGVHYHLTVPYGLKTKVYQFGSTRAYPNTMANKFNCETKFYFSPPDRLFKLYKSTTINTHQKRIPYKQLLGFGLLVTVALSIFIYGLTGAKDSQLLGADSPSVSSVDNPLISSPDGSSVPSVGDSVPSVPSVSSVPSDAVYDPLTRDYIVDSNLVPVSGMRMGDSCSLYNKNGVILTHISFDDCSAYLDTKGMMPKFDRSSSVASVPVKSVEPSKLDENI